MLMFAIVHPPEPIQMFVLIGIVMILFAGGVFIRNMRNREGQLISLILVVLGIAVIWLGLTVPIVYQSS